MKTHQLQGKTVGQLLFQARQGLRDLYLQNTLNCTNVSQFDCSQCPLQKKQTHMDNIFEEIHLQNKTQDKQNCELLGNFTFSKDNESICKKERANLFKDESDKQSKYVKSKTNKTSKPIMFR